MSEQVYRIVLSGECRTKEAFDQVLTGMQNISKGAENVNVNISGVGTQSELSLDRMARGFLRVGFMFNMYESALMRQEMAQYMVTNAQDAYNQAVERYGPASDQAMQAHRRLQQMIDYTDKANMRANISTALLTTQIVLQTGILEGATRAQIVHQATMAATTIQHGLETAAIWAKNAAMATYRALQGPAGWAILAGAGAAMAGYGIWTLSQSQQTNIVVNVDNRGKENLDEAFAEAQKQTERYLRRSPNR